MTTRTVRKFDTDAGARNALDVLERLQKEELIEVVDAAIDLAGGPQEAQDRAAAQPGPGPVRRAGASGACCSG